VQILEAFLCGVAGQCCLGNAYMNLTGIYNETKHDKQTLNHGDLNILFFSKKTNLTILTVSIHVKLYLLSKSRTKKRKQEISHFNLR